MPRAIPDWKDYFLDIAFAISKRSKDPNKQVGCIIVNQANKTIVSGGYNGMVMGVNEVNAWENKENNWLCHAEMNAVALAARNGAATENCHIYITLSPCLPCTRLIIQAGIKAIHTPKHWRGADNEEEHKKVLRLLELAKIPFDGIVYFVTTGKL